MHLKSDEEFCAALPKEKAYKIYDNSRLGIYLCIRPNGNKFWRKKYRFDKKEKTFSFGRYPDISLDQVREKAKFIRKLLENGIDPMDLKKKKNLEYKIIKANLHIDNSNKLILENIERKKNEMKILISQYMKIE